MLIVSHIIQDVDFCYDEKWRLSNMPIVYISLLCIFNSYGRIWEYYAKERA